MNNLILSPAKIDTLEQCPRLHYFRHILNYNLKGPVKYFSEGEFFHLLCEHYYKDIKLNRKQDPTFYQELGRNLAIKFEEKLPFEETEILIKLFLEYLNFYPEETWIIEEVEQPFMKELYSSENYTIFIQGKCDLLAKTKSHNIPIVIDHKLVSQNRLIGNRDNQKLAYLWATDRTDFIINSIGKQKTLPPEKKFLRQYFNYDKHQIEEWKENTIVSAIELIGFARNSHFPARYNSCINKYNKKCSFYPVCDTTRDNWEYKLESEYEILPDYQEGYFPKEEGE